MDYRKFIQGRRIALVGPAPNLIGTGQGAELESYDVIVKTGGAILIDDESYFADYGRRCDVLYINIQFSRTTLPLPAATIKARGLQWLRQKAGFHPAQKPVKHQGYRFGIVNMAGVSGNALMGNVAINEILMCKPKELLVAGFDFYTTKPTEFKNMQFPEYFKGYLPNTLRKESNAINRKVLEGRKKGHNYRANAKWIHDRVGKVLKLSPETEAALRVRLER